MSDEEAPAAEWSAPQHDHTEQRVIQAELGEMTEMESMCPRCQENGTTRLMITKIPHFREVIVSSFECPSCGERNNEIQFGGTFGAKHTHFKLDVKNKKDLNRQVVKSEYATITIPELELEVPPQTQKGMLNTVEGILQQTIDGLLAEQESRKQFQPEIAEKVAAFLTKCAAYQAGDFPFTVELDDPAGNSYIEPIYDYYHPTIDPQLFHFEKDRTEIDRQLLGLAMDYNEGRDAEQERQVEDAELDRVMHMETVCSACAKPGMINMHQCNIPHFKDTIIMAFKCDFCGYKSNEIKSGGAVSPKGVRIVLEIRSRDDLSRDLLKSDTAALDVPEAELELAPGTLGGFFSTVEGTIRQVIDQLGSLPEAQFVSGDSATAADQSHEGGMKRFIERLEQLLRCEEPWHIVLDDPMANVYIQNPRAHLAPPDNVDPQLKIEEYSRTYEQDEELGFHDMHV